MNTMRVIVLGIVSALGSSGCGSGGDRHDPGGATYDPALPCLRVESDQTAVLLQAEHLVRVSPAETLVAEDSATEIGMRGTMDYNGAFLQLRFERCWDVSRVNDLTFETSGFPGYVAVALDSPSNLRPPEGSCVVEHCYAPHYLDYLDPPSTTGGAPWKSFVNGSPSPVGDPEHVVGISWLVTGQPGDPVDLTIGRLLATTLP
jgi:hypothetical protein